MFSSFQPERFAPTVHGDCIGRRRRSSHANDSFPPGAAQVFEWNDQGSRCAVSHGRSVQQVDRFGYHRRPVIIIGCDWFAEACVGIMHSVSMRVDREGPEIIVLPVVFVQVALHYQRVDRHEGQTLVGFPIGVRGSCQLCGNFTGGRIGHFFYPNRQSCFQFAGRHRHNGRAECKRS